MEDDLAKLCAASEHNLERALESLANVREEDLAARSQPISEETWAALCKPISDEVWAKLCEPISEETWAALCEEEDRDVERLLESFGWERKPADDGPA
jgi:hypothetical protein